MVRGCMVEDGTIEGAGELGDLWCQLLLSFYVGIIHLTYVMNRSVAQQLISHVHTHYFLSASKQHQLKMDNIPLPTQLLPCLAIPFVELFPDLCLGWWTPPSLNLNQYKKL